MPTPRKATYDDVNRAIYDLSEKKVLDRVNIHDELVDALGVALQTIELGPDTIAKGNTIPFIKDLIARATGEETK